MLAGPPRGLWVNVTLMITNAALKVPPPGPTSARFRVPHHVPHVFRPQVTLPALHVADDFVGLLAHGSHVQLGFVAESGSDVFVQTAPGSVGEPGRDGPAGPLSRRPQRRQRGSSEASDRADGRGHVGSVIEEAFMGTGKNAIVTPLVKTDPNFTDRYDRSVQLLDCKT